MGEPHESRVYSDFARFYDSVFGRVFVDHEHEVTPGLISVLDKAMATRREDRYASALEMQDALATILYSREPTFSSEMIQQWMRWLFADDLVREGRPAQVSPRFEQQLQKWGQSAQPSNVVVAWEAVAGDPTPKLAALERGLSGTMMSSRRRRFRAIAPWIAGASVLVAAAVGVWVLAGEPPVAEHATPAANHAVKDVTAVAPPPPVDATTSLEPTAEAPALAPLPPLPEPVSPKPKLDVPPVDSRVAKAAVLFDDAKALTQERLYNAAAAKLDECLRLMPGNADCHRLRGNVWAREGQIAKGEKEYREFLKYAPPDHPDIESVQRVLKALDAQR